jgi:hypothetical protein
MHCRSHDGHEQTHVMFEEPIRRCNAHFLSSSLLRQRRLHTGPDALARKLCKNEAEMLSAASAVAWIWEVHEVYL